MTRIAIAIAALAGLSLLAPWAPVYDPWGWLVWGREAAALALDTSAGPSWKPLPVLFTTPFSALGEAAPSLWLFVARAGWFAAVAIAARLAASIAARAGGGRRERIAAGALAALGIVLLADGFTPWLRQFAGGLSEPLMTALVLAAAERALAGRERAALALAAAASLIRPEIWPALVVYGAWLWRDRRAHRPEVVLAVVSVAALWFVPDLLGSGSFFTGAERAREGSGAPPIEALEVLVRAAALPLLAPWVGFALCLRAARGRGDRAVLVLALGSLAWVGLVAVMAAAGYAGLPRFLAPAAGVVCALGGAGLAALAAGAARERPARPAAAALAIVALALVVQGGWRAGELVADAASATRISASQSELEAIVEAAGPARVRECGPVVVGAIEGQTVLAWVLDVPIAEVEVSREPPARGAFFERDAGGWLASAARCPQSGLPPRPGGSPRRIRVPAR